jgi:5-enolpyruvylshikimate-3-phosphate synthase
MARVIEPLRAMGADDHTASPVATTSPRRSRIAPCVERLRGSRAIDRLAIASAQVKTALLLAGLYADGATRITRAEPVARSQRAPAARRWARRSRSTTATRWCVDGRRLGRPAGDR